MNIIKFLKEMDDSFKKRREIIEKKGYDYADPDSEFLLNFKQLALLCKSLNVDVKTPPGVAIFYILMKTQRINNLYKSGKSPQNESVEDTLNDLLNYVDLLRGCLTDEFLQEKENKKPN